MQWEDLTLGAALRAAAQKHPDAIALVDGDQRVSYRLLDAQVDELAQGMAGHGIGPGDQVALWMTNCLEWVVCWFACARVGATLVTVNTRYKVAEVEYILRQSNARMLVMMDRYWSIDYLAMLREMVPELDAATPGALRTQRLPDLRTVVLWRGARAPGTTTLETLAAEGAQRVAGSKPLPTVQPQDPVIIVYTSGTTGKPKGAMHSHVFLRNCANMAAWMRSGERDVVLGHMPFYHVAGAFAAIGQWIVAGCKLVTLPHWVAGQALDVIEREGVTIFGGIPTHFIDCIDELRERPRRIAMKSAWIGGATVTPEVARAAVQALGLTSLQAVYGMTETTSMTTLSGFEAPLVIVCQNKGKPIGQFEVKVCDPATGEPRPANSVGEVWVRGHIVMLGYYRHPEATSEVITPDGWFRTGDAGFFDEAGYLQITARLKEMFIVGGSNAYPAEIESVLQEHPAVRQAVVVGVPDRRLGEVGFAFVEPAQAAPAVSEEELIAFCKSRMADYKVPRHVRFVDGFERTTTGKIQRHVLGRRAAEVLQG